MMNRNYLRMMTALLKKYDEKTQLKLNTLANLIEQSSQKDIDNIILELNKINVTAAKIENALVNAVEEMNENRKSIEESILKRKPKTIGESSKSKSIFVSKIPEIVREFTPIFGPPKEMPKLMPIFESRTQEEMPKLTPIIKPDRVILYLPLYWIKIPKYSTSCRDIEITHYLYIDEIPKQDIVTEIPVYIWEIIEGKDLENIFEFINQKSNLSTYWTIIACIQKQRLDDT